MHRTAFNQPALNSYRYPFSSIHPWTVFAVLGAPDGLKCPGTCFDLHSDVAAVPVNQNRAWPAAPAAAARWGSRLVFELDVFPIDHHGFLTRVGLENPV